GGVDERRERRLLQARVLEEYRSLLVRQFTDLRLQTGGEGDDVGVLGRGFIAKSLQVRGVLADLILADVGHVQHRLRSEKGEALEQLGLLSLEAHGANGLALIEMAGQPVEQLQLLLLLGARLDARGPGNLLSP